MSKHTQNGYNTTLSKSQKFHHRCVCQICTCGHHHCPKGGRVPFDGNTTHKKDYVPHPLQKNQNLGKPQYKHHPKNYNPDDLMTSYKADYQPKKVPYQKQKAFQHPRVDKPFYGQTEYNKNYFPMKVQQPPPPQKVPPPKPKKFDAKSSYQANYVPHEIQKPVIEQIPYKHTKMPFEGKTSYENDYKKHPMDTHQPRQQPPAYKPGKMMQKQSAYQKNYKDWGPEHYKKDVCPILQLPKYPRECSPGKNHVHYEGQQNRWD